MKSRQLLVYVCALFTIFLGTVASEKNFSPYPGYEDGMIVYVNYIEEFLGHKIKYEETVLPLKAGELQENLIMAKKYLKESIDGGFSPSNECVAYKMSTGNSDIWFLPPDVWINMQAAATTWEEEYIIIEYQEDVNGQIWTRNKKIVLDNAIVLPSHKNRNPLIFASLLIHEYVHQCDRELLKKNGQTYAKKIEEYQTLEGYIEQEQESYILESRFFEYMIKEGFYSRADIKFTAWDIFVLSSHIRAYKEYKKNNLKAYLKYRYNYRFKRQSRL
jgi:hypothetical protein